MKHKLARSFLYAVSGILYVYALLFYFATVSHAQEVHSKARQTVEEVAGAIDTLLAQDSTDAEQAALVPFTREIFQKAAEYRLPPSLLAAVTQEESRFDPTATRTEPLYKKKTVIQRQAKEWSRKHGGLPTYPTELDDRSRSYGLMQPMGQLAREQGFSDRYLAALYQPLNNLDAGARKLRELLDRYHGDTLSAISAYNQGNNRKKNGSFENARYVYRVSAARKAYDKIWKHHARPTLKVSPNSYKRTSRPPARIPSVDTESLPSHSDTEGDVFAQLTHRADRDTTTAGLVQSAGIGTTVVRISEGIAERDQTESPGPDNEPPSDARLWLWQLSTGILAGLVLLGFSFLWRSGPGDAGHGDDLPRTDYGFLAGLLSSRRPEKRSDSEIRRSRFHGPSLGFLGTYDLRRGA